MKQPSKAMRLALKRPNWDGNVFGSIRVPKSGGVLVPMEVTGHGELCLESNPPRTYRCSNCRGIFELLDDEAAQAEAEALFGVKDAANSPSMAIVCDDCFKRIMAFNEGEDWEANRAARAN